MSRERNHPDQATSDRSTIANGGIARAASVSCLPEISLVAALFEDAVCCAQRASRSVTHQQSWEAREWFASERSDWPFAFVNVCDLLGIDAKAVRKYLGIDERRARVAGPRERPSRRSGTAAGVRRSTPTLAMS
jgi:hypothetical protein